MAFDRSKFVGASRKAQKEIISATERRDKALRPKSSRGNWHTIEEGRNVFRVAPPHNPDYPAFIPYKTVTLDCEKPVYEDGEDTGRTEVGKKKIIVATQHHDELMKLGVHGDVVELYVRMAKDIAFSQITDKKERSKFLAPISGYRAKDGKWVWGIEPKTNYIGYVFDENKVLGKLEIYPGINKDLDRLADELEADAPLDIDPWSNPVEGYPIVITRAKNDAGKTEYIVDKEVPSRLKKESWDDFFARTALTDEQLEELANAKPLAETYINSFTLRDFEAQMDGLTRFDKKYGFGIIETEEFQEAAAHIESVLRAEAANREEESTEEETEVETKVTAKVETKKPIKKAIKKPIKKAGPTVEEMTDEVTNYVTEVYGEEYVPQIPTDEDTLVAWFNTVKEGEENGDLPLVPDYEFVAEEDTDESVEETQDDEPDTDDVVDGEESVDVAKLREQMEALRKSRR